MADKESHSQNWASLFPNGWVLGSNYLSEPKKVCITTALSETNASIFSFISWFCQFARSHTQVLFVFRDNLSNWTPSWGPSYAYMYVSVIQTFPSPCMQATVSIQVSWLTTKLQSLQIETRLMLAHYCERDWAVGKILGNWIPISKNT